ncbi:hypothetical protein [Streptomyces sp. NPDC093808]|uniref:hypothetical protein n=1 Tax=Streptomyces sp. NPDC093808 TaxID=3154985 RepID=UPI00344B01A4
MDKTTADLDLFEGADNRAVGRRVCSEPPVRAWAGTTRTARADGTAGGRHGGEAEDET